MNLVGVPAHGVELATLLSALLQKHGHLAAEPIGIDALLAAARSANSQKIRGNPQPFSEPWVLTAPVISTGHITEETNNLLIEKGDTLFWMTSAKYEDGFFVSVPSDELSESWPEGQEPPADLAAVWAWARDNKFDWVRLDSSGDVIEHLPTYDW